MLDGSALVLNSLYQAIQITSVAESLVLLYKGEVYAVRPRLSHLRVETVRFTVQAANDEFISTPCFRVKVPRVVLLRYFDRLHGRRSRFTRRTSISATRTVPVLRKEVHDTRAEPRSCRAPLPGGRTTWTTSSVAASRAITARGIGSPTRRNASHPDSSQAEVAPASEARAGARDA